MPANVSFAEFVKESREKKKREALAQEILGSRGRKANGSGAGSVAIPSPKPSLLSRMSSNSGVTKSRSSSAKPAANIEGKWQHDLHKLNNPHGPANKKLNRTASASQIDRNTRTFDKFRSTLQRNAPRNGAAETSGFNIRGVAAGGPYSVIASNFAPGTTANDIEAVMGQHGLEHGGELLTCKIITSNPTVMVELVFTEKKGAENVIEMFNGKKADGRTLYVYMNNTPNAAAAHSRPVVRPGQQKSLDDMDIDMDAGARSNSFQDGRLGFSANSRNEPPRGPRRRY